MLGRTLFTHIMIVPIMGFILPERNRTGSSSLLQDATMDSQIPKELQETLAILKKYKLNRSIVNCLPTIRDGKCYRSNTCNLPQLKYAGIQIPIITSVCRDPSLTIVIEFDLPKLPWWIQIDVNKIVIPVDHNKVDDVTRIHSHTSAKLTLFGFLNVFKADLMIDGLVRWNCTKPLFNRNKRIQYNVKAPNEMYNSPFYDVSVRLELKKKDFGCFCYRCVMCKDLFKRSGVFGRLGPAKCITEAKHNI